MKRTRFDQYVSRHDRIISESVEFDLDMTLNENLNEWSWPFSFHKKNKSAPKPGTTQVMNAASQADQDETNKTKQAEAAIKNVAAFFKAVNYTKHASLKEPATAWVKASRDVLAAIQAERKSHEDSKKTQVMSRPSTTPANSAPKPPPSSSTVLGGGQGQASATSGQPA